jgi:hypothetical protein
LYFLFIIFSFLFYFLFSERKMSIFFPDFVVVYNELGFLDRKKDRHFPFREQKIEKKGKDYEKEVQDIFTRIQSQSSQRAA